MACLECESHRLDFRSSLDRPRPRGPGRGFYPRWAYFPGIGLASPLSLLALKSVALSGPSFNTLNRAINIFGANLFVVTKGSLDENQRWMRFCTSSGGKLRNVCLKNLPRAPKGKLAGVSPSLICRLA